MRNIKNTKEKSYNDLMESTYDLLKIILETLKLKLYFYLFAIFCIISIGLSIFFIFPPEQELSIFFYSFFFLFSSVYCYIDLKSNLTFKNINFWVYKILIFTSSFWGMINSLNKILENKNQQNYDYLIVFLMSTPIIITLVNLTIKQIKKIFEENQKINQKIEELEGEYIDKAQSKKNKILLVFLIILIFYTLKVLLNQT